MLNYKFNYFGDIGPWYPIFCMLIMETRLCVCYHQIAATYLQVPTLAEFAFLISVFHKIHFRKKFLKRVAKYFSPFFLVTLKNFVTDELASHPDS